MKRILTFHILILSACLLNAQNPQVATTVPVAQDTAAAVVEPMPTVSAEYAGADILELLSKNSLHGGNVTIEQTPAMKAALSRHIASNHNRRVTCYRVRIFFDNSQNARAKSESVAGTFSAMYPGVPVYRSYASPFFKVTVGDFRTRSEAQLFAQQLTGMFPSVFLVKESIHYPALW